MNNPKVSVIIVTYNLANYICEAVDSVLAQTYKNFEIIVIDDGSTDDTKKILRKYGSSVKYIFQSNQGISEARNTGIRVSDGEYLAFLDADDVWLPDKLTWQINAFKINPEVAIVFTDVESFNEEGVIRESLRPTKLTLRNGECFRNKMTRMVFNDGSTLKGDWYEDLIMGNMITPSAVIIKKMCLSEVGYFDYRFLVNQDYDLWLRLARVFPFLYLNRIGARYRVRAEAVSGKLGVREYRYHEHDSKMLLKHFKDCPEQYKNLIRKRILRSSRIAVWGYLNLNELKKAREICIFSLSIYRFQLKLCFYLLLSFLPPSFFKGMQKIKKYYEKS